MPEGDTIWRAARTLRAVLVGREVRGFSSTLPEVADGGAHLPGHRVTAVEPHGKHLLIHFDDGTALHTHMRMTGSWHVYRAGEAWQKRARGARVVIDAGDWLAVCFHAPVVALAKGGVAPRVVRALGPDVLADDLDPSAALARLRARPSQPIGEALLAQRALAGIGNIYKSESLHACRVHPLAPVASLSDDALLALIATARRLMRANLDTTSRRTSTRGPRHAVYRRAAEPCLTCATPIERIRQGDAARSTYFCPRCQSSIDRVAV
ncbi:MAG TPA: DNA-formamidopyrimidine glycosylase family protein [Kofleriaceae bacterium]|nr:DNA-formamidopyrimidine glycosylase family protein [Kofleriaceae bacterium]